MFDIGREGVLLLHRYYYYFMTGKTKRVQMTCPESRKSSKTRSKPMSSTFSLLIYHTVSKIIMKGDWLEITCLPLKRDFLSRSPVACH